MYGIFLIQYFRVVSMSWLAVVSSAGGNTGVRVPFYIIVLSGHVPRSGMAGSCASSVLFFSGSSPLFSIVVVPVYSPTSSAGGFPFLHTRSSICFL